jgi:regulatory protein
MPEVRVVEIVRLGTGQERTPGVEVRLDDGSRLRLPAPLVASHRLAAGQVVAETVLEQLRAEAERHVCRRRALRLLATRARSEEELRARLVRADFSHRAIEGTMQDLRHRGLVNDRAYALEFAERRRGQGGHAPARIERELRGRGIDREIAHSAAWEPYQPTSGDGEARLLEEALALLERRNPRWQGLPETVARRRMAGLLARGGYPGGIARDAIDAALERLHRQGRVRPDPE